MTQEQHSNRKLRGVVGTAILIMGSAVFATYSAVMAWQLQTALDTTAMDSLGCFGALALASLHLVRAVALDHAAVLSVVHHILILFSAFVVMLAGIALLPRRASSATAPGGRSFSAPTKGDQ